MENNKNKLLPQECIHPIKNQEGNWARDNPETPKYFPNKERVLCTFY